MDKELEVRGSSITYKFDYVRENYGAQAEAKLKAEFNAKGQLPVLDALWYPYSLYLDVNMAIVRRHFGGDVTQLQKVGQYSAERALTTTYRAYVLEGKFVRFLERISALHRRFYSSGQSVVKIGADQRSCRIELSGKPSYPAADMYVAQGFYAGAAKHFGLIDVVSRFTVGTEGAHFDLIWSVADDG